MPEKSHKRPYAYSKGKYTFINIGNKDQAEKDIEKRYNALKILWNRASPEEKKRRKEIYVTKMKAIVAEKNRLAKEHGYSWHYRFDMITNEIKAYRNKKIE